MKQEAQAWPGQPELHVMLAYSCMVYCRIACNTSTSDFSILLHLDCSSYQSAATSISSLRQDISERSCVILVHVYMYVNTWRTSIFFYIWNENVVYLVILEGSENMDPLFDIVL
jgi:hypothetical protein